MTSRFGYACEFCDGTVRPKRVDREAFKHQQSFVILEEVLVGVCDRCRSRYYSAETLKQVEAIATARDPVDHTEQVPVARAR